MHVSRDAKTKKIMLINKFIDSLTVIYLQTLFINNKMYIIVSIRFYLYIALSLWNLSCVSIVYLTIYNFIIARSTNRCKNVANGNDVNLKKKKYDTLTNVKKLLLFQFSIFIYFSSSHWLLIFLSLMKSCISCRQKFLSLWSLLKHSNSKVIKCYLRGFGSKPTIYYLER